MTRITHAAGFSPLPAVGTVLGALALACVDGAANSEPDWTVPVAAPVEVERYQVPPPPLSDGAFPCSDCHDPDMLPTNPEPRELRVAHQDIVLHHDEQNRWCLDCHDADDRDELRLASGKLVPFEESYRLCGQCHGDKYRDWRAGVHGRRTGHWDGQKSYLLCVACHDAHDPRFKPIEPKSPPRRPERTP